MPPLKGADRTGLRARCLSRPGGLVRGRGWSVPGYTAAGQQLAAARSPCNPAARVCPGWHVQDPDPVPSRNWTSAPPAGQQLHQLGPAWLAQGEAGGDPGGAAGVRRASRCGGDPCRLGGLAGRPGGALHLARPATTAAPAPRVGQPHGSQDRRDGSLALPAWIMPLYTPLGGSWLNMAESVQRILKRRTLDGQHPQSPKEIGTWFQQTAQAWNQQPTPFLWNGKRRQRRRRHPGDGHAIGGSAARTERSISPRRRRHHEWHTPRQVTH